MMAFTGHGRPHFRDGHREETRCQPRWTSARDARNDGMAITEDWLSRAMAIRGKQGVLSVRLGDP